MRGAPERDASLKLDRPKRGLAEDMDIRAPVDEGVEAVRSVPVVVSRREVYGDGVEAGERLAQKLARVPPSELVFVEIAAAEERVCALSARQVRNSQQGVPQRLTASSRRVTRGAGPGERGVQVEIREVNDSHYDKNLEHRDDERQGTGIGEGCRRPPVSGLRREVLSCVTGWSARDAR